MQFGGWSDVGDVFGGWLGVWDVFGGWLASGCIVRINLHCPRSRAPLHWQAIRKPFLLPFWHHPWPDSGE